MKNTIFSLIIFGSLLSSDRSIESHANDFPDRSSNVVVDTVEDNITFQNIDQKYSNLVKVAHQKVLALLEREGLEYGNCERADMGINVKVIHLTVDELNDLKSSGEFGPRFALQDKYIQGMFELSTRQGVNRMYLTTDGNLSPESLFIHEYTHAYFYANCILDLNSSTHRQDEEAYAQILESL